ncbi:MAG: DNA-protecting protein DprA [Actinobacteria bacterium]|nr:DNA-protecting protein DprA [Actinomycetota bacterium]
MKTRVITRGDPEWPVHMDEIGGLPPPEQLYVRGKPIDPSRAAVAIVGTRRATVAGLDAAASIAAAVVREGWIVVSGMARGIDAAAHRAALEAGGSTVAVLGTGVDICYPPRNTALYDAIGQTGTLISEYPDGTPSARWNFPRRNRIIVGCVPAGGPVVVVEGGVKSGALITARYAIDASREVFAVPGSYRNAMAAGPNELIRSGQAALVASPDHLFEALEVQLHSRSVPSAMPAVDGLSPFQKRLLLLMDDVSTTPSRLQVESGIAWSELSPALASLEIRGLVSKRISGYEVTASGARARRCLLDAPGAESLADPLPGTGSSG